MGNTNNPFFRVVVADSRSPADGRFIENIGWYDPMRKDGSDLSVDTARVDYWVKCGAQLSPTAKNLVVRAKKAQAAKVDTEAAVAVEEAPVVEEAAVVAEEVVAEVAEEASKAEAAE